MQIYPPVPKEEIAVYLKAHGKLIWGDEAPVSDAVLETVAEAMAMITALDVPDDTEPLFP